MKIHLLLTFVCAVAAGAAGGMLFGGGSPTADPGVQHRLDQLGAEVERVARATEAIASRLEVVEERPAPEPARVAIQSAPAAPAFSDERAAELLAALNDPERPLPDDLRQEIGAVVTEIRAAEELAREERRRQAAVERMERRLQELAQELSLTPYQVNELRQLRLTEDDKRRALFEEMRDGALDRDVLFDGMRGLRDQTQQDLARFLAPDQITKYNEMESDRGRFGGGRGWGGRNRDGAGNGPQQKSGD